MPILLLGVSEKIIIPKIPHIIQTTLISIDERPKIKPKSIPAIIMVITHPLILFLTKVNSRDVKGTAASVQNTIELNTLSPSTENIRPSVSNLKFHKIINLFTAPRNPLTAAKKNIKKHNILII